MSHRVLGPMFHGTTVKGADGILATGADPGHGSSKSEYGQAFYVSPSQDHSEGHSGWYDQDDSQHGALLRGMVHARNPRFFSTHREMQDYLVSKGHGGTDHPALADLARADGHDYVQVGGHLGMVLEHGGFHPDGFRDHDPEDQSLRSGWTDLT